MRTPLFVLAALGLVATVVAQGPFESRQLRNNNPHLVQSTATHPTTGRHYNWWQMNHLGYSDGSGVPAGAHVWRVFPRETAYRGEPHKFSGYTMVLRISAASNGNGPNAYEPGMKLMACTPRVGGGLDPDFTNSRGRRYHTLAEAAAPVTSQTFRVTTTFAHIPLILSDYSLAMKYHGGEEQDIADGSAGNNPSQGMCGSWQDSPVFDNSTNGAYITIGFEEAGAITYTNTDAFISWMGILVNQPSLAAYSDWGRRRMAAPAQQWLGHSLGTYSSDLASAPDSSFGYSVRAGALYANGSVAFLANIGGFQPIFGRYYATPAGPVNIALDLLDTGIDVLSGIGFTLDANGDGDSAAFQIWGPHPSVAGLDFGVQAVVVAAAFVGIDSTEAVWMRFR